MGSTLRELQTGELVYSAIVEARRTFSSWFLVGSLAIHGILGGTGVWLVRHPAATSSRPTESTKEASLAGDSFDIASEAREAPIETLSTTAEPTTDEATKPISAPPRRRTTGDSSESARATLPPATFGAVGDRSATLLLPAIARGFSEAASTDPAWRGVSLGDAGSATLEVELDDEGRMLRWSLGAGATPAMRQGFVRTMALIGGRSFIARGQTTKLAVSVHVTTDAVREGGESVYALHTESDGPVGNSYFSLSVGRRVDLTLRETR
jgi:hypothetical protein